MVFDKLKDEINTDKSSSGKCTNVSRLALLMDCFYVYMVFSPKHKTKSLDVVTPSPSNWWLLCVIVVIMIFFILLISFFKVPAGHTIVYWVSHFLQTTFNGVSRCFLLGL